MIPVERAVRELRRAAHQRPPDVPAHIKLQACERPHWDAILRTRPYDEWEAALLPVVAQMSWLLVTIERERALLDAEGAIIRYRTGTPRRNPRATLIVDLTRQLIAMRRGLGIGAAPRTRRKR